MKIVIQYIHLWKGIFAASRGGFVIAINKAKMVAPKKPVDVKEKMNFLINLDKHTWRWPWRLGDRGNHIIILTLLY